MASEDLFVFGLCVNITISRFLSKTQRKIGRFRTYCWLVLIQGIHKEVGLMAVICFTSAHIDTVTAPEIDKR